MAVSLAEGKKCGLGGSQRLYVQGVGLSKMRSPAPPAPPASQATESSSMLEGSMSASAGELCRAHLFRTPLMPSAGPCSRGRRPQKNGLRPVDISTWRTRGAKEKPSTPSPLTAVVGILGRYRRTKPSRTIKSRTKCGNICGDGSTKFRIYRVKSTR